MINLSTRRVGPEGPREAEIALVGEAPGAEEDLQGRPFVGRSGVLLNNLLTAIGLDRSRMWATNVVKHQPYRNIIAPLCKPVKGHVVTSPEFRAYEEELYEELRALPNLKLIIAFGNIPLWALYRRWRISKWRGSPLRSPMLNDMPLIPVYHPASVLRKRDQLHSMKLDLNRAKYWVENPEWGPTEREIHLAPSARAAINWINQAHARGVVGFDIEVVNEEVFCFAIAHSPTEVMCIPLAEDDNNSYLPEEELAIWDALAQLLKSKTVVKVMQNGIFDAGFLWDRLELETNNIDDTMIAQAVANPGWPKGLHFIVSVYAAEPYFKDDGKKWKQLGMSVEVFWRYNALDAATTLEAWYGLKRDLEAQRNWATYVRQVSLLPALLFMQAHGIRVDVEGREQAAIAALKDLRALEHEFRAAISPWWPKDRAPINLNSSDQLAEYFYKLRGHKPYHDPKTKAITTAAWALKKLAEAFPEASIAVAHRELAKYRNTYLLMELDDDGRLRTSFNPVGADATGRLSSSENIFGRGGNIQNLPKKGPGKDFFRLLLPDPDHYVVEMDLSQAENRIVAYVAREHRMIEAFATGDVHKLTAALVYSALEDRTVLPEDVTPAQRDGGKTTNHALNYGMGPKTFSERIGFPLAIAKRARNAYHDGYPNIRAVFWKGVEDQLNDGRVVENLLGRRRRFFEHWGEQLFDKARSFVAQSTVADILNDALVVIYRGVPEVTFLNQVHDSLVFQIPMSLTPVGIANILRGVEIAMSPTLTAHGVEFVIPVDCKIGATSLHSTDMIELLDLEPDTIKIALALLAPRKGAAQ